MEAFLIQCDNCSQEFNHYDRLAKMFPMCGHTLCQKCIFAQKEQDPTTCTCPQCGQKSEQATYDTLPTNDKIMKILAAYRGHQQFGASNQSQQIGAPQVVPDQEIDDIGNMIHDMDSINQRTQPLMNAPMQTAEGKVYCYKHTDKEIEYFCKFCHTIVCSKCMFSDHNGHELAQLEDVTNIIKQNIYDLNKLMLNTKRINDDNRQFIEHIKQEIQRLNEAQARNIDKGFNELIQKLQERRDELKQQFAEKYIAEENKVLSKNQILDQNTDEIASIEVIYGELFKFIEKNSDAKILTRINDISQFISRSIEALERIAKCKGFDKNDVGIDPGLKPLNLNVQKAFDLISKFSMVAQPKKATGGPSMPGGAGQGQPSSQATPAQIPSTNQQDSKLPEQLEQNL